MATDILVRQVMVNDLKGAGFHLMGKGLNMMKAISHELRDFYVELGDRMFPPQLLLFALNSPLFTLNSLLSTLNVYVQVSSSSTPPCPASSTE